MTYTKQAWSNGRAGATPVNATRMGHIEDGVAANDAILSRKSDDLARGIFYPEAHGALFDGATDDLAAWAATFSAASARPGAVVDCPSGKTSAISSNLVPPAMVTIEGNGATVKMLPAATTRAILIQNKSLITVRNLTVDMNAANTVNGGSSSNQQGVLISATSVDMAFITLENVTVKNGWQRGISAVATSHAISDLTIDGCDVDTVAGAGIFLSCAGNTDRVTKSTSQRWKVRRCNVTSPGLEGIQVIGSSIVTVDDNTVDGKDTSTGSGIVFSTSGATGQVTDFSCTRNKVTGFTAASKWAIVVSNNCKRFDVTGNPITDCTGGVTIDPEDSGALGVIVDVAGTVSSNPVKGCTGSTGHGINARICTNLAISGNTLTGGAAYGVVVSNAYGCAVSGNVASGNAGWGISIAGTNAGTGGHTVGPNVALGNTLGAVRTDATPIASAFATTQATP